MYTILFGLWALTHASVPLEDRGLIAATQAADLRTTFSDGADSVYDLTKRAEELGLDSIAINDHLIFEIEYGIFPFEHLIKYKKKLSSLQTNGLQNYFDEIKKVQKQFPGVIIIPGLEVSPFYWWSGSLFNNSITVNNWENHIGIMGLEDPEVISNIPVVHNHFTVPPGKTKLIRVVILSLALILTIVCMLIYRNSKLFIFLVVVNALLVVNYFPFAGPEINIYSKPPDMEPYQKVIDYVNEYEGISVWHHMEAINGMGKKGRVNIHTPKHPEDLLKTSGFMGFQGLYEDTIHITDPGKEWDQALMEYVNGKRYKPPWTFGGLDYHGVTPRGPKLKNIKNVFWVSKKSKEEIMKATREGRFYTVRQGEDYRLILDNFSLSASGLKKEAISGEIIDLNGEPIVKISISANNKKEGSGTLTIIQNGKVEIEKEFTTPFVGHFTITSTNKKTENLSYVRLMVHGKRPNIIKTNPIFYRNVKN